MRTKILFLPFEAVGTHFRKNSKNGTQAHADVPDQLAFLGGLSRFSEQTYEAPASAMAKGSAGVGSIGFHLTDIVAHQCAQFIALDVTDQSVASLLEANALAFTPENIFRARSHLEGHQVKQNSPEFIVLSENPTREEFPDEIAFKVSTVDLKYKNLLSVCGTGIRSVNEMAFYIRDNLSGDFEIIPQYLERSTKGLYCGGKIEHMLKVTMKYSGNICFSFVGVHLRATLTKASQDNTRAELAKLRQFLIEQDVDFAVGDFNLNVALDEYGYVGSVYDMPVEHIYPCTLDSDGEMKQETSALEASFQQFSNSTNSKHYMGTLLASDNRIGYLNVHSGSRSTAELGFYSDHPALLTVLETKM